jgi:hypothetical protein
VTCNEQNVLAAVGECSFFKTYDVTRFGRSFAQIWPFFAQFLGYFHTRALLNIPGLTRVRF